MRVCVCARVCVDFIMCVCGYVTAEEYLGPKAGVP